MRKHILWYLLLSLFLILSTIIYEWFSFGVTSIYMRLSFLIPLLGGSISLSMLKKVQSKTFIISLWHMSLYAYAAFMILTGIFEIYGSSEPTVIIFLYLGVFLTLLTLYFYIKTILKGAKSCISS
ncbi:MAG: hypothetical protein CVV61_00245 [Tenericutes bacterium HGW-Tenericutes-6]|jgi:hypothetical protein|nr:MAG: hypothetical protein CVV61_00245 [Tenericutes bacterium HGW-Tenericutes-6]